MKIVWLLIPPSPYYPLSVFDQRKKAVKEARWLWKKHKKLYDTWPSNTLAEYKIIKKEVE